MRVCFVTEEPATARVAAEAAPVKGKAAKDVPERRFEDEPEDVHRVDEEPHQRDAHRCGASVVKLHGNIIPGRVGHDEAEGNLCDHCGVSDGRPPEMSGKNWS